MESGNVIIRLIADIREFMAKMNEGEAKVGEFAKSSEAMGARFQKGMAKAQTAVIATGVAIAAYGVKSAYDYVEALDKLRTQAGASAEELEYVKQKALEVSSATAQSSGDIVDAYIQVEKAGIRGARATELVTNAAKAANITHEKTADIAKQVIAAQTLQITKGMSVGAVTDLIVRANQQHIGSLNSLFSVLSGKVGGALAAYGVTMAQAASISNIAAKAGYTNTRSLATLATSMAKVENPTKSYAKSLAAAGLNANKLAADAKRPGGIVNVLKDIQVAAHATGQSVSSVAATVFGASGGALATILTNNLPALSKQVTTLSGSSSKGLETAFGISQEQLGTKIAMLKTQLQNAFTGIGLLLLPSVEKVATFVTTMVKEFHKHPMFARLASDAAIGLFVGAVVAKLTQGVKNIIAMFKGAEELNLLRIIARNTGITAGEGGTIPGTSRAKTALKAAAGTVAGGTALAVGGAAVVFAGGYLATRGNNEDVTKNAIVARYGQAAGNRIWRQIQRGQAEGQTYTMDKVTGFIASGYGTRQGTMGWSPTTGAASVLRKPGGGIVKVRVTQ